MRRTICIGLAAITMAFTVGCGSSVWQKLVTAIETGLENGTALAQLEAIVVQYFPQFANDAAIVDSILQAVISLLQTTGVLTPPAQVNANALQGQIGAKLAAAKKSGRVLPEDASDVIAGIAQGRHLQLVAAIQGEVSR